MVWRSRKRSASGSGDPEHPAAFKAAESLEGLVAEPTFVMGQDLTGRGGELQLLNGDRPGRGFDEGSGCETVRAPADQGAADADTDHPAAEGGGPVVGRGLVLVDDDVRLLAVLDDLVPDLGPPEAGEGLAVASEDDAGLRVAGQPPDREPDVDEEGLAVAGRHRNGQETDLPAFQPGELLGEEAEVVGPAPLALGEADGEVGGVGLGLVGAAQARGKLLELLDEVVELDVGELVPGLRVAQEAFDRGELIGHAERIDAEWD
jgi:hypothetical protein